jgi:hypothetical protein
MLGSFLLTGITGAAGFTWLNLELLGRIQHHQGDPLVWAVFQLAILPLTLACWAVPLAALYRVSYDKRVPAGLPTWRKGHKVGLQAHYRSVFWRGYAALFAWSLLLLLPYLITVQWWLVYLHLALLVYAVLKATLRQARLNRQEQVVIDQDKRIVSIPPYGEIPWSDLKVAVQEELTVTPKKDLTCWWVTINGQNWKRCEIPEHAQAIADWLRVETCNSPESPDPVLVKDLISR